MLACLAIRATRRLNPCVFRRLRHGLNPTCRGCNQDQC
jgi:hypothetical protein